MKKALAKIKSKLSYIIAGIKNKVLFLANQLAKLGKFLKTNLSKQSLVKLAKNLKQMIIRVSKNTYKRGLNFFYTVTSKPDFYFIAVLVVLGFTPLLWYSGNSLALGHDMGFPLNPTTWFLDRLHTFNDRYNLGQDQSVAMAGLILHGFEALMFNLSNSIHFAQKFTYIVWFMLPGISMYIFVTTLLKTLPGKRYIGLLSGIMFMFNLFFLQGWFIAERNKFAVLAAIPLTLFVFTKVLRDNTSALRGALAIGFIYFLLNGGGSLPLFGSSLIIIPGAFIVMLLSFSNSKKQIWRGVKFAAASLLSFLAFNAFWLLPQIFVIRTGFAKGVQSAGGVEGLKLWIDEISKNANYIDLLRGEGFPDWSATHHYAGFYTNSLVFIIGSFIFLLLTVIGLYYAKKYKQQVILRVGLISLVLCTLFAAGTNGLLGDAYFWLVDHVPMFILFRTPFYKFAGGIAFAIAIFAAIGAYSLIIFLTKYINKQHFVLFFKASMYVVSIVGILLYSFPFLTGSFFDWNKPISTMLNVPDYVYNYGNYTNSLTTSNQGRTLIVPDVAQGSSLEITNWNFFSLDQVPTLVSRSAHLSGTYASSSFPDAANLVDELYLQMYSANNLPKLAYLLNLFNVNRVLLRLDSTSFGNAISTDPIDWQNHLNANPLLNVEITLGDYVLYTINKQAAIGSITNQIASLFGNPTTILDLFSAGAINSNTQVVMEPNNLDAEYSVKAIDVTSLDPNLSNDALNYNFNSAPGAYTFITKSFPIEQLWYSLTVQRSDRDYLVTLVRPNNNLTVNQTVINTNYVPQQFKIESEKDLQELILNDQVFNIRSLGVNSSLDLGQFKPNSTKLTLSYTQANKESWARSVLNDYSFETSTWGGLEVCGGVPLARNASATKTATAVDGKYSLNLNTSFGTRACVTQVLKDLSRENLYKINFAYKNTTGQSLQYCIMSKILEKDVLVNTGCVAQGALNYSEDWQTGSISFFPGFANQYELQFILEANVESVSNVFIDQVKIDITPITGVGTYNINTGIEKAQTLGFESGQYETLATANLEQVNNVSLSSNVKYTAPTTELGNQLINNLWGGANFCGGDVNVTKITATVNKDEQPFAKLSAQNGVGCLYTSVPEFKPSYTYKVSFDYKNIGGNNAEFCALLQGGTNACSPKQKLGYSADWKNYSTLIPTTKDTKGILLHLYAVSNSDKESTVGYKNVTVQAVYTPAEKLVLVNTANVAPTNLTAQISKVDSTYYFANVSGDGQALLQINMAYDPYWYGYKQQGVVIDTANQLVQMFKILFTNKSSNPIEHVATNALTNGWWVESGNYGFIYMPQVFFYFGLGLTVTSLFTAATYLWKKRK